MEKNDFKRKLLIMFINFQLMSYEQQNKFINILWEDYFNE